MNRRDTRVFTPRLTDRATALFEPSLFPFPPNEPQREGVAVWARKTDDDYDRDCPEGDLVKRDECPAGGRHVWTDDVDPSGERLPRWMRWHCDECGARPPDRDDEGDQ